MDNTYDQISQYLKNSNEKSNKDEPESRKRKIEDTGSAVTSEKVIKLELDLINKFLEKTDETSLKSGFSSSGLSSSVVFNSDVPISEILSSAFPNTNLTSSDTKTLSSTPERTRVKCKILTCPSDFNSEKDMLRHYQTVHEKLAFKCPFCSHLVKRRDNLKTHITRHHKDKSDFTNKPDWFKKCDIKTEVKETVYKNPENRVTCDFPGCCSTYNHIRDMRRHMNTAHFQSVSFICNICDKEFMRKDYLKVHMDKICGRADGDLLHDLLKKK